MKKEFVTTNAKFVYSKNELGYQEVLDSFDSAKEITIITYNISEKSILPISKPANHSEAGFKGRDGTIRSCDILTCQAGNNMNLPPAPFTANTSACIISQILVPGKTDKY